MAKKVIVNSDPHPIIDKLILLRPKINFYQYFNVQSFQELPTDPKEFLEYYRFNILKDCSRCPLFETRNRIVAPDGNTDASLFVVGEGPGFLEDLTGIPLTGAVELYLSHCNSCGNASKCFGSKILKKEKDWQKKSQVIKCSPNYNKQLNLPSTFFLKSSGQIIDGILNSFNPPIKRQSWYDNLGINQTSPVFITNVTKCRTTAPDKLKDSAPKQISIGACSVHLLVEFFCVQPKVVLCLGTEASKIFKVDKLTKLQVNETELFGPVVHFFHPSFIMRDEHSTIQNVNYGKLKEAFQIAFDYIQKHANSNS